MGLTAYSIVAYFREQRKWNLGQQATQFYNFCSETLGHLACSVDYKHKYSHIKLVPRAARLPEKKCQGDKQEIENLSSKTKVE